MIAKPSLPVLLGGAVLLAGCAQSPPAYYYQPVPQAYYSAPYYRAPPARRTYAPQPETPPAHASPSPLKAETETARRETIPPKLSLPTAAGDCVGWWRICHFL
jgi:hypothetical protein